MNLKVLFACIFTIACLIFSSCSSSDDVKNMNFSKMRVARMDLSNAVSVGVINNETRADGTFLENGLYKIDANGNISTVAVYLVEDEDGNVSKETHTMYIRPSVLQNLTSNYFIVWNCDYYDENGERGNVPFYNLLVRKNDGKIWCVDNVENLSSYINSPYSQAKENDKGELYCFGDGGIFKFNLDSDAPSFSQINRAGLDPNIREYYFTQTEVVWGMTTNSEATFVWPNLGYQTIDHKKDMGIYDFDEFYLLKSDNPLETGEYIGLCHHKDLMNNFIIDMNSNPYLISINYFHLGGDLDYLIDLYSNDSYYGGRNKYDFITEDMDAARIYKLKIGNQPGTVEITGNPVTAKYNDIYPYEGWGPELGGEMYSKISFCSNDRYIITSIIGWGNTYISLIDVNSGEWNFICNLDYEFRFGRNFREYEGNGHLNPDTYISSMGNNVSKIGLPEVNGSKVKLHWIDFSTLKVSTQELDVEVPTDHRTYGIKNGIAEYEGVNPYTGNTEIVKINLYTGQYTKAIIEPDMVFATLIPLN